MRRYREYIEKGFFFEMSYRLVAVTAMYGCMGLFVFNMGYWNGHYEGRQMGSGDTLDVLRAQRLAANEWQKEAKRLYLSK